MSAYETLAGRYDALTQDVPYEKFLAFYLRLLKKYRCTAQTVLDLACGTGSLSVLLAQAGCRVIGADCSEQMLTEAAQKTQGMENAPFFILQKMQNLRLPEQVDAAICCLDGINYLTSPADCKKAFRRVYDALRPGGLFIFDINSAYKLRNLDGQIFLDETEDTYCVWRAEFDKRKNICFYGFDLFLRQGERWARSDELHAEYAYSQSELTAYLREAGFSKIGVYGDRVLRAPKETEQRIFFAAKKE